LLDQVKELLSLCEGSSRASGDGKAIVQANGDDLQRRVAELTEMRNATIGRMPNFGVLGHQPRRRRRVLLTLGLVLDVPRERLSKLDRCCERAIFVLGRTPDVVAYTRARMATEPAPAGRIVHHLPPPRQRKTTLPGTSLHVHSPLTLHR